MELECESQVELHIFSFERHITNAKREKHTASAPNKCQEKGYSTPPKWSKETTHYCFQMEEIHNIEEV